MSELDAIYALHDQAVADRDALLELNAELLNICHELHALLWHYDLARQPNGVDWATPDDLRQEYIAKLEALFVKAGQP